MKYVIHVRGKRHEWGITIPERMVDDLRDDGFEVMEVVNTVPMWVVDLGLTRVWCWCQDVWNLPSTGWRFRK